MNLVDASRRLALAALVIGSLFACQCLIAPDQARAEKKPNILVTMGDDVGWFNIRADHHGIMSSKTPNLDKLAAQGMLFTDYYAEASCMAGRAAFHYRGNGADVGIPEQASTIAVALKTLGYDTGQFGKNHLGDKNKYLPCVHGFDEFFGYLYHLDAMEDPCHPNYPPAAKATVGPRNMVHSWATDVDDPTEQPRWARSASRGSRTPVPCVRIEWRPWTTRSWPMRSSSSTRPGTTGSHSSCG